MVGKAEGDSLEVRVEPAEGYREVDPNSIKVIERAAFAGVESVEAGMAFQAKAPDGTSQHIVVKKVEDDDVTSDLNHPLAGVTLNFDIHIVGERKATEEERAHGHAH